jgi:hypothetical protein
MIMRPNIQIDDVVREMTEEEYAALIESGWTETPEEETSGERSASDNVEEEGEPNDPIPDSGSAPSPS